MRRSARAANEREEHDHDKHIQRFRQVEVALVVVVQFEGDKLAHEHLYWDQASVLVQLGLLEPGHLPVVGAEAARSVVDRKIPLNGLIPRAHAEGGTEL